MTHAPLLLAVVWGVVGAELPADYSLPEPPGPFVGAAHAEAAGSAGGRFKSGAPLVATTYFYWYDEATRAHIVDYDGTDALTDHPVSLKGFSYKNVAWHAAQLSDMIDAGIDVAMPVYWGTPAAAMHTWSDKGLPPLAAAREKLVARGERPPAIGMFYDTSTLRANGKGYHVDLTTPAGRLWFYGTIRNFFSLVPPKHRAVIDGKPLVFLYAPAFAKRIDEKLFPAVRKMFRDDFGTDLFLVKMRGWPGQADSEYQWGAALFPQILDTAAVGPGYDHSAVPGRDPLVRPRDGGRFYRFAWEKLLALDPASRPWLAHVETWSEFHEGTEICQSAEYGRQYIDLTRHYADLFHRGRRIAHPFTQPAPDVLSATVGKSQGVQIAPKRGGDGPIVEKTIAGRRAWSTTQNRHSAANRYMYFNVEDLYLHDVDEPLEITIGYFDAGPDQFVLEYDSADPSLEGLAQMFRPGGEQKIRGSKTWKEATFTIPHARLAGRTNGSDFRLACVGEDLCVSRVTVRRVKRGN